ncbi:MAG TPA: hypothetical protein VGE69_05405 [Pseudomonadales bacterium]
MNRHILARTWMLLASLAMPAAELSAQARSNVQGTIDSVMLDEQYIVVDGERMPLREDELVVTWKGEALRPSLLKPGMSIFFSTQDDGTIRSITLIGPADLLEQIDAH